MDQGGQNNSGLKKLLTFSSIHEFFQGHVLGGLNGRDWLARNVWKLRGGETVIDIGCGTGNVLIFLPADVKYYGIDISDNYIRTARARFSTRGTFFHGTAPEFLCRNEALLNSTDVILCNGLLHHLTDAEAMEILTLAKQLLKSRGRLICLEAAFLAKQTRLSRWVVSSDRGRYVRSEREWNELIARAFASFRTSILTGLTRIPYTHIVIECVND